MARTDGVAGLLLDAAAGTAIDIAVHPLVQGLLTRSTQ
jgi:hypothetical protein